MLINTREIAQHLARLSQLLESNAAFYAALNQFEDAAGQLSKEAKDIAELAAFLYDAKQSLNIDGKDFKFVSVDKKGEVEFYYNAVPNDVIKKSYLGNAIIIDLIEHRKCFTSNK